MSIPSNTVEFFFLNSVLKNAIKYNKIINCRLSSLVNYEQWQKKF